MSDQARVFLKNEGSKRLMEMGVPLEVLEETAKAIAVNRGNSDEF